MAHRSWLFTILVFIANSTGVDSAAIAEASTNLKEDLSPEVHQRPNNTSIQSGEIRFTSPGRFLFDLFVDQRLRNLQKQMHSVGISTQHRARLVESDGPLRQIEFIDGDRLTAEILEWQESSVKLRLPGRQRAIVPTKSIYRIHLPCNEVELIDFDFGINHGNPTDRASSNDLTHPNHEVSMPPDLRSSRVQFGVLLRNASRGTVDFAFEKSSVRESISIQFDGLRCRVSSRDSNRKSTWINLRNGRHQFTVQFAMGRILFVVDDILIDSVRLTSDAANSEAVLKSLQFNAEKELQYSRLLVSRLTESETATPSIVQTNSDQVTTHAGDELFGKIESLSRKGIHFSGNDNRIEIPWSEVAELIHQRPGDAVSKALPPERLGMVSRLTLQPVVDRPANKLDELIITITDHDVSSVVVDHAWLGRVRIDWKDIWQIRPLFWGAPAVLDARRIHLGDSIRADFRQPSPDGHSWSAEFIVPEKRNGNWNLSLNAVDVEPCGPDTPPGSPFLKQLRDGHLLTEVFLNNKSIGSINQLTSYRATASRPDRIQIRLPPNLVQTGVNTIELKQRPSDKKPTEFDDIEIHNLRLEFVSGP